MKGIMFTEDMFEKAIKKEKDQTRRTGGLKIANEHLEDEDYKDIFGIPKFQGMETNPEIIDTKKDNDSITWKGLYPSFFIPGTKYEYCFLKPRYQLNEIVYLKEPFHIFPTFCGNTLITYKYLSSQKKLYCKEYKWKNKMYMPAKYARYFVKVTNIKCERLYDISEEDAKAEGVKKGRLLGFGKVGIKTYQEGYFLKFIEINGMKMFNINPFVFAYTFCLTDKPDML